MNNLQYELFEPNTVEWQQEKRVQALEEAQDRLRKGLFSRLNDQSKEIVKLHRELDYLRILLLERKK
jgi:hypothetical protein